MVNLLSASTILANDVDILRQCWAVFGLPFSSIKIEEKSEGIIDPEALLLSTVILPSKKIDSFLLDVAVWVNVFEAQLSRPRLKTLFLSLPVAYQQAITSRICEGPLLSAPSSILTCLGPPDFSSESNSAVIQSRIGKIANIETLCKSSLMISNRLLFSVGSRADIVSLASVDGPDFNGKSLARLAGTSESTVSRVLRDLKTCGFLDRFNRLAQKSDVYPGMFLSTHTLNNLSQIIDASKFEDALLERETLSRLDLRFDYFHEKSSGRAPSS